jgi:hypothetical protein
MKKAKPTNATDPIFAVLDAWRRAADLWLCGVDGNIPDKLTDQHYKAFDIVIRTRPTTLAGLAALINWMRIYTNAMDIDTDRLRTLVASIADATEALVKKGAVICGDMSMLDVELARGVPPSMMVRKPASRKAVAS